MPDVDGQITASTCSPNTLYDTRISVYSGSCDSLVCVAGNDDGAPNSTNPHPCNNNGGGGSDFLSEIEFPVVQGETYYLMIHGFGSSAGDFELTLTCDSACTAPVNDECATATSLPVSTDSVCIGLTGQTNECATGLSLIHI